MPTTTHDEAARQRALDRYHVLDSLPEGAFDDVVQLASTLCGTPTALISLVDRDRQWFKARTGFDPSQTERSAAVCDHAIRAPGQLMEIPDLSQDARFASNPYVNGERGDARFYAGMPLVTPEGAAIGTVCVLDAAPRELDEEQRAALRALARLTVTLLEARARERTLEHEAFVATVAPASPPAAEAPAYLLALMELQDFAGAVGRLGERGTEKLLQQLDAALEQVLPPGGADAVNRSIGSGEYVAVLHGAEADAALDRIHAVIARETAAHGLRFVTGTARGSAAESAGAVFMRAETDLLDRRADATA
ncbi:GAF domain-containing protein [Coralloluteibacterium stylophorae]|uniref:GAF domain-containing protein n=1 Tax=Coralloluteibacterium stylophorae TaxID=1776034 RepID=A0A8J8AYD8_9GAMM|nr:GAF domain-containing protein [Coralloluteibacterium stylophorae]MBS7456884.1 GAF domain-containing protein [Coralloluteibacterium stylophorae]